MKIINFEIKKMKLLTEEQKESYKNAKICYICKYRKVRDHIYFTGGYRGAAHSICNLKYSYLKIFP